METTSRDAQVIRAWLVSDPGFPPDPRKGVPGGNLLLDKEYSFIYQ